MKLSKKAGANFISIGLGVVAIIAFALFLPILHTQISDFLATTSDPLLIFLIGLAPLSILVGIILRVFRGNNERY